MQPTEHILFKETQRFRQAWVLTLLFAVNFINLYSIYVQVIQKQKLHLELGAFSHFSNAGLIRSAILVLIVTIFILTIKLDTMIKPDGVYVRFFPIHMQYKFYPWHHMSNLYIRSYSALTEYGGWGLRGLGSKKAYNVAGNIGLQIDFKNKGSLLIGTQKSAEMQEAIQPILEVLQRVEPGW